MLAAPRALSKCTFLGPLLEILNQEAWRGARKFEFQTMLPLLPGHASFWMDTKLTPRQVF